MASERRACPFLLYRDGEGRQLVFELRAERATIGRRAASDVALPWDAEVSRLHAELSCAAGDWIVHDEGLSHNGTYVNDERVRGRRRLHDGDVLAVGATLIAFCLPGNRSSVAPTRTSDRPAPVSLTPAQRRVAIALCRPLRGAGYAAPASNRQIADELALSVETVKGTLSALFDRYGLASVPQSQKRAALAARALELEE
jgi:pSer/pThr/pTyr-binding forkhead associated (FHA) protein